MARRSKQSKYETGEDLIPESPTNRPRQIAVAVLVLVLLLIGWVAISNSVPLEGYQFKSKVLRLEKLVRKRGGTDQIVFELCVVGRAQYVALSLQDVIIRSPDARFAQQRYEFGVPNWKPKDVPRTPPDEIEDCAPLYFKVPEDLTPTGQPVRFEIEADYVVGYPKGNRLGTETKTGVGVLQIQDGEIRRALDDSLPLEGLI